MIDDETLVQVMSYAYLSSKRSDGDESSPHKCMLAALKAIKPLLFINNRNQIALVVESTTCDVEETNDYYSGYCDAITDATNAVKEMK